MGTEFRTVPGLRVAGIVAYNGLCVGCFVFVGITYAIIGQEYQVAFACFD